MDEGPRPGTTVSRRWRRWCGLGEVGEPSLAAAVGLGGGRRASSRNRWRSAEGRRPVLAPTLGREEVGDLFPRQRWGREEVGHLILDPGLAVEGRRRPEIGADLGIPEEACAASATSTRARSARGTVRVRARGGPYGSRVSVRTRAEALVSEGRCTVTRHEVVVGSSRMAAHRRRALLRRARVARGSAATRPARTPRVRVSGLRHQRDHRCLGSHALSTTGANQQSIIGEGKQWAALDYVTLRATSGSCNARLHSVDGHADSRGSRPEPICARP